MSRAHITSIEALERFRATLAEFAADARDALCAVDGDIHRAEIWLQEQGKHWQREIRKRQEDVNRARNELASRKYQNRDGRGLGSTEQEKALKKALARLEEAETKLANCKRWAPEVQRAVHEYHGPARMLSGVLDTDVVNALALLANKLAALEAYLNIAPPSAPSVPTPTDEPEMATAAVPVAEGLPPEPPPVKEEAPS